MKKKQASFSNAVIYPTVSAAPKATHSSHALYTELPAAAPRSARTQAPVVLQPPTKNGPSGLQTNRKVSGGGLVGSGQEQPDIIDVGGPIFADQVRS